MRSGILLVLMSLVTTFSAAVARESYPVHKWTGAGFPLEVGEHTRQRIEGEDTAVMRAFYSADGELPMVVTSYPADRFPDADLPGHHARDLNTLVATHGNRGLDTHTAPAGATLLGAHVVSIVQTATSTESLATYVFCGGVISVRVTHPPQTGFTDVDNVLRTLHDTIVPDQNSRAVGNLRNPMCTVLLRMDGTQMISGPGADCLPLDMRGLFGPLDERGEHICAYIDARLRQMGYRE